MRAIKKPAEPLPLPLVIARGNIGGTWASNFHHLSREGKIGFNFDRTPTSEEREAMLVDIRRHRKVLMHELQMLSDAEAILRGDT